MNITEQEVIPHRLALISRKGRRRILNEQAVVDYLQPLITSDLVEFSGMSFTEQVQSVQKYTIFAALNGAGLMNAIYLPKHSVTIQMVPYNSGLNFKQYSILLKARGPYLEWHNTYQNLTEEIPVLAGRSAQHFIKDNICHCIFIEDTYNNRPNTIVHLEEFKKKVTEAIDLYNKDIQQQKLEL